MDELSKAVSSISEVAKSASEDLGAGLIQAGLSAAEELKYPAKELSESVRVLCENSRQATEDWTDALLCTEKIADHLVKTQEHLKNINGLPSIYPNNSEKTI